MVSGEEAFWLLTAMFSNGTLSFSIAWMTTDRLRHITHYSHAFEANSGSVTKHRYAKIAAEAQQVAQGRIEAGTMVPQGLPGVCSMGAIGRPKEDTLVIPGK